MEDWPLCGYSFEYDLTRLPHEFITERGHIPTNWNVYTPPVLPQYVNGTIYVDRLVRNHENPMVADISSFEFESRHRTKTESSLGFVYPENSSVLSILMISLLNLAIRIGNMNYTKILLVDGKKEI